MSYKRGQAVREDEEVKKIIKENKIEENKRKNEKYLVTEVISLPIEDKLKLEQEYERSNSYKELKDNLIEKKWHKTNSSLKKIGDYLYKKLYDYPIVSLSETSEKIGLKVNLIKQSIGDLNFWRGYPLTIIPVPKKKGYVQSILKNETDGVDWERKKSRSIDTMEQTKDKGELLMRKFFRDKPKLKEKIAIKQ
jgi:K+/H+ antiporter YhaU regulatory subunit KhtT